MTAMLIEMAVEQGLRIDRANGCIVVKETERWVVSVLPMIFNDRVVIASPAEYPGYAAGWCYDKGGAAILAALAWDPDVDRRPVGFKKEACDAR